MNTYLITYVNTDEQVSTVKIYADTKDEAKETFDGYKKYKKIISIENID